MSEIKHPGPWKFGVRDFADDTIVEKPFDYQGSGYCENPFVFDANGTAVVGCDEYCVFESPEAARLIAAAPELYEALQEIINTEWIGGKGGFVRARAALAKARGEQ